MKKEKFNIKTCPDGLKQVLTKQCKCAGLDVNKVDFNHDRWYSVNTWTEKQEAKFKNWFIETLYKNNKLRNKVLVSYARSKRHIRQAYSWWNLQYGFKIVREKK